MGGEGSLSYREIEARRRTVRTWIGIAICLGLLLACVPVALYVNASTDREIQIKASLNIARQYEGRNLLHQAYAAYDEVLGIDRTNETAMRGRSRVRTKWDMQVAAAQAAQQEAARQAEAARQEAAWRAQEIAEMGGPQWTKASGNIWVGSEIYVGSGPNKERIGTVLEVGKYWDPLDGKRRDGVLMTDLDGNLEWHPRELVGDCYVKRE